MKVGFIGTGEIGAPMAGHIAKAGHRVVALNRTKAKAEALAKAVPGVQVVDDLAELALGADVVITCVGDDSDLTQLFLSSDALIGSISPGALVIDHTTASADIARELEAVLKVRGIGFVDAPVSGGSAGAQAGTLAVMIGGSQQDVDRALSVINLYSARTAHIGASGAGQLTKMVNQVCIAGVLQGLAEGLALAKGADLDTQKVLAAIGAGAAGSWQMENRSSFMIEEAYAAGFAARLMHKDLRISVGQAANMGVPVPVAALVLQQYARLLADGWGGEDFSNLHRLTVVEPG